MSFQRAKAPSGSSGRAFRGMPQSTGTARPPCAKGDMSNIAHVLLQGGATIEQLRQSTRANIKVERESQGCLERLICISSAAAPAQPLCPAQDALFCVQDRLNGLDSSEACLTVGYLRFCQHLWVE